MSPRILVALAMGLVLCPFALAGEVEGLKEIYQTPIPAEVRRNFDRTLRTHTECPTCRLGVLDGEKYFRIYPKKFIVLGMEPNSFGGVWAVIAVEGESRNAFHLWLYDISDDEYQLRSIEELPGFLEEALVHQIHDPAYRQYWL